jgi:hypothetical protein
VWQAEADPEAKRNADDQVNPVGLLLEDQRDCLTGQELLLLDLATEGNGRQHARDGPSVAVAVGGADVSRPPAGSVGHDGLDHGAGESAYRWAGRVHGHQVQGSGGGGTTGAMRS